MTEKLLAWFGSQPLKDEVMDRLRKHRAEDDFIQGIYQTIDPQRALGYRGCAIGCTLPKATKYDDDGGLVPPGDVTEDWHWAIEHFYGIPWRVAGAIDDLFEALPAEQCGDFAVDVIEAIPVGADLDGVVEWWRQIRRKSNYEYDAEVLAPDLIERLRNTPVPIPA
jgi:hypothetical protein